LVEKSVEQKLQKLEDFIDVQNLMGRYAYYISVGMPDDLAEEIFAGDHPTFRIYLGENGYWDGPGARKRAYGGDRPPMSDEERQKMRTGNLVIHAPICPVIEIAGDGKTAKGVWMGIGLIGFKNRKTGEPGSSWEWDKYGVDFIKVNGKWKAWHFHIYRLLHGWDPDKKWAEQFIAQEPFKAATPDGPAIDDNPYRPDTVQRLVPKPPDPYETWADTKMY